MVVGLIKKCIRGAGYRRRRAQRGKRGRAARRGGRAAHTHSIADGTAEIASWERR